MNKVWHAITVLMLVAWVATPALADDVCYTEKPNLIGKTFVAKEMLYDTKVGTEGIIKLEWDKEAIQKGTEFQVLKVECKTNKIELTLRPISDRKVKKVDIYFLITTAARSGPDGKEKLHKIMSYVWAEPGEDSE